MDIVVVFNGLGNQMSQYAFFLAKKEKNKNAMALFDPGSLNRHNGSELDALFGIKYPQNWQMPFYAFILKKSSIKIFKLIFIILGIRFYSEPRNYDYSAKCLKQGKGWLNFYFGGWHSERYFIDIRQKVLETFSFNVDNEKDTDFIKIKNYIIENKSNIASLHVRRGDYLEAKPGDFYNYSGIATDTYYKRSINYLKKENKNIKFLVFSNDIEWCKLNFSTSDFIFITCNPGKNSWRDMYLMSLCKYHIIANSTFSWWGAWLNDDLDSTTICPERFLSTVDSKDFYPKSWIRIPSK